MLFKDNCAIVTGGTRGIGRSIISMLAREGANVVFTYLKSSKEAQDLAEEVKGAGARAIALQMDVRDIDKAKELIERAKAEFGRLDILINNAGITRDKALMMMTKEDWQEVIDTNLSGVFNVTRSAIVTFLKQKKGNIVNISSISGIVGLPRQANYSASKAGIIGFTKALAREVGPYNIRVNAVAPGFIETDMVSGLNGDFKLKLKEKIPLSRFGTTDEVADSVKFLLSEHSGYITGQTIILDGGLSLL